jgi:hypothetical protein
LGARTATAQFEYWVDNAGSGAQVAAIKPLGQIVAPGTLAALATDCKSTIEGEVVDTIIGMTVYGIASRKEDAAHPNLHSQPNAF